MNAAAVILAAGESRRMGFPKALLRYREESFVDTLVGLFAGRCAPVIVVVGAQADQIRAQAKRPATFVVNHNYQRGQTSSLQCGLRAVPAEAAGVLFALVDHPSVMPATLDALLADALRDGSGPLLRVPRHRNQRGHPIWFARELIPQFLALPESSGAREIVRGHAAQTEFVDVDDPGILADIDDPAAYRKLTGAVL